MLSVHKKVKKSNTFTFSISNFLLMVMHLFKRSLYFSSNFCCSSICLLRSQFAYEAERSLISSCTKSYYSPNPLIILNLKNAVYNVDNRKLRSVLLPIITLANIVQFILHKSTITAQSSLYAR